MHRFDSKASESTVEVHIPTEASIGLTTRHWLDTNKDYTLEQYQREFHDIVSRNFDRASDTLIPSHTVTSHQAAVAHKLEDDKYMRSILDKLMEYANAQYRYNSVSLNGEEFNKAFLKRRDDYSQCKSDISSINQQIVHLLEKRPGEDIESKRLQISVLLTKIRGIDDLINQRNKDLNEKLNNINMRIRDIEGAKRDRDDIERSM